MLSQLTDPRERKGDLIRFCEHARHWVSLDPLNEEAHRRLMRGLAEVGQRSAAFAQFEYCRRVLQSELGIEPEPATLALFEELKQSVPLIPTVSRPQPTRSTPPLPAVHMLDRAHEHSYGYPTPFVGRKQEMIDITVRLENPECRLLTLTGLGGSGKTRLAIECARSAAAHFSHGAVFVALQPVPRSDLLVPAVAQALGLSLHSDATSLDQVLDYLEEKTLLLVLDNFEHLLDGAMLVDTVLTRAPWVTVLATSREALHLRGEWLYPLSGLSTPQANDAATLENYEAVQLFLSHARRVQPHFDLAHEHEAIVRICQMTAGLPLAIELAASWLKGSSLARITHEMQHSLDMLSTTIPNVEERHRSMRAIFDQSWHGLGEHERLVFARLSVFRSGFDGQAAEAVAGASFANLATLVEKSLLQIEPTNRFSIHELLRQYAMEQLEVYGEMEAAHARHSQFFAQLMLRHEAALQQPHQRETLQAIECDFDNIRLAWEWSTQNKHLAQLHIMIHGLYLFGFLRSRHPEIIALFQQTLDQSIADSPLLGRLLARRWGYLQWGYQSNYGEALAYIEQALAIAEAEKNQFEMAFCYLMVAYAKMSMGRYGEALPPLETSKTLFETINEPYYVCWVLHRLGYVYANLNKIEKGNYYTEQSLALARETHNQVALVICLYNLGSDHILNGNYIKGRQCCTEALQVATEAGHQSQVAHALTLVALCAFLQADYTTCQEYVERAQTITERLNRFVYQAYSLSLLTLLACLREEYVEAVRLSELAQRHSTNTMGFQLVYWALAVLSCGIGRPAEARGYIQKALELAVPTVNPGPSIWIVPCVVYTLAETDPAKAIELLSWVSTSSDTALSWACHWPLFERLQVQLHKAVSTASYQMHWEKGQSLSVVSIMTYLQCEFRVATDDC